MEMAAEAGSRYQVFFKLAGPLTVSGQFHHG